MAYRPDVRLSTKDAIAAWCDVSTPLEVSAKRLGVHRNTIRLRARTIGGLPARTGKESVRYPDATAFWTAGCTTSDIAAHYGCSHSAMVRHLTRTGARKPDDIMRKMGITTVAEVLEARLAARMAESAAIEQAMMINCKMVDVVDHYTVGARQARTIFTKHSGTSQRPTGRHPALSQGESAKGTTQQHCSQAGASLAPATNIRAR